MGRSLLGVLFVSSILLCTGCGAKIFHARFDHFNGGLGDPTGEVPGDPTGDFIAQEGNGGLDFAKIAGDKLLLRQEGAGSPSGAPKSGRIYLITIDATDLDFKRTLSWTGRSTSGTGFNTPSLTVEISGQERRTEIDPWPSQEVELRLGRDTAELRDAQGNSLAGPMTDLGLHDAHKVYMLLDLSAKTIEVTITPKNKPKRVMTGTLPNSTVNLLKDSSRMVVRLWFPDYVSSQFTGSYAIDEMIMRGRSN